MEKRKQKHLQKGSEYVELKIDLQFRGIDQEEKEYIPILPSWAYSKEEIKELVEQYIKEAKKFHLHT